MGVWAVSFSPPLTRKGLQVYSSMPPGDADNYKRLKTALLQQYELTEDGFRQKFRENQSWWNSVSVCSTAEKIFHKMT